MAYRLAFRSIKRLLTHCAILLPVSVYADTPITDLASANKTVADYRELRYSCATGEYETRRLCLRKLSQANEAYKLAKDFIASHNADAYLGFVDTNSAAQKSTATR